MKSIYEREPGHRYGKWAGDPYGTTENEAHCATEVSISRSFIRQQCGLKRGHGPGGRYCKKHAKKIEAHYAD